MHARRSDAFHEEPNAEAVPAGLCHTVDKALESTARGQVVAIVAKVIPVPECNGNAVPWQRIASVVWGRLLHPRKVCPGEKNGHPGKVQRSSVRNESQRVATGHSSQPQHGCHSTHREPKP